MQKSTGPSKSRKKVKSGVMAKPHDILSSLLDHIGNDSGFQEHQLNETERHNRAMEAVETSKARWSVFAAADAELSYQMKLQSQYEKLQENGSSNEYIAHVFPQMICFFDPSSLNNDEKKKYAATYNKWNIARGLPGRYSF